MQTLEPQKGAARSISPGAHASSRAPISPHGASVAQLQQRLNASPSVQAQYSLQRALDSSPRIAQQASLGALLCASAAPIQRHVAFEPKTQYLDSTDPQNQINSSVYANLQQQLEGLGNSRTVTLTEDGQKASGTAAYRPFENERNGEILIGPRSQQETPAGLNATYATVAHEMRHAHDDLGQVVGLRGAGQAAMILRMRSEWRAWATEAAVVLQHSNAGLPVTQIKAALIGSYASKAAFKSPNSTAFGRTKAYLVEYGIGSGSDQDVAQFMNDHDDWVTEAVGLFNALAPQQVQAQSWWPVVFVGTVVLALFLATLAAKFK